MDANQKSAIAAQNLFYDDSTFPLMEDDDVADDQQRAVDWRPAPGVISVTASQSVKGGFSRVWRVDIHRALQTPTSETYSVAVKELRHDETREENFEREVECLKRVDSVRHPHLIRLLATRKTKESYQLVFPWADGNLRSLWKTSPKPSVDKATSYWMLSQLQGLASGLMHIHDYKGNSGKENGLQLYGLHGDIKPANILVFSDAELKGGRTLKIADFGLSQFHRKDSQPSSVYTRYEPPMIQDDTFEPSEFKPRGYSPTYRAPEFDLETSVGRAYDVWSLGCVFLEFITWMLYGYEALDTFASIRASAVSKGQRADDAFFELFSDDPGGKPRARIKSAVSMWINELRSASETTRVFREFLDLTEKRLLEVDPRKRATSPTVATKLEDLKTNCQSDPEYTKPKPLPRKPPCSIDTLRNMVGGQSHRPHTVSVNMVRLPPNLTGNHSAPVDARANTTPAAACFPSGFENGTLAANTFPPYIFDPPYTVPTRLHQNTFNTCTPAVPVHQASNVHRNIAPASHKRKIDSIVEQTDTDEGNGAKCRNLGGSVSCDIPQRRHRDHGPARQQREESGVPSQSPRKYNKEEDVFACPFHKRDPETYGTKSCIGPGWTIPRLKSVLARVFEAICGRCFAEFETADQYANHLRSEIPCFKVAGTPSSDTIDELQKAQIQKRLPKKSSLEKWNIIYRIIFSLGPGDAIPSPYQDTEQLAGPSLEAFEGYLTNRMRDDEIDMNLLSDIAAFPSLIQDTLETTTTQSSVTTSSSLTLDPPPDPPPETAGNYPTQLEKPLDMFSFLDDAFLDEADGNSLMNWVYEAPFGSSRGNPRDDDHD
ncbi:hypothetical protein FDECE_651 [Fusarium decemcellulare]|nr:hypothetical protein FDECE_651 [Fusarium decemcellulare]